MPAPTLKLIVLKTAQVESLREFYARLGFQFVTEQHGKGPQHYSAPLGDGVLEIYPLPEGKAADTTTRLGFGVAELSSVLKQLGTVAAPQPSDWGLQVVLRDPDGRTVELYEIPAADATS